MSFFRPVTHPLDRAVLYRNLDISTLDDETLEAVHDRLEDYGEQMYVDSEDWEPGEFRAEIAPVRDVVARIEAEQARRLAAAVL